VEGIGNFLRESRQFAMEKLPNSLGRSWQLVPLAICLEKLAVYVNEVL
jgi:hypothetical protein